ncbi:BCD family MFS transporter [Candidatus Villigracilis saccharophilus]|uniref:BCD family MFS transporter n=1 Tax=Candidatus Villigracilis saccharophilus TaxID=3140684 RepID=UPI003135CB57|nr:BCD family MFS transporter [Anaerolineales bacterium]
MFLKRFQLGLIHVAVAMTLVPINSTLNRVMIKELSLSATLVAVLASLPYLFAPIQVAIGSYSDRHPIFGLRRTPYILSGLILCVLGVIVSPQVAFLMAENFSLGLFAGIFAFGLWGMGYNLSAVSYLSLATELSAENERGKTIATMWFMMIVSIIATAIGLSRMVDPYTPEALIRAFGYVAASALTLGLLGLIKLEPRSNSAAEGPRSENYSYKQMSAAITANPVARTFFIYLLLLLAAILGQDVLLEPFGAEAFNMTVTQTTRITSLWGTFVLVAILIAGLLEGRVMKKTVAQFGNIGALAGFVVIVASGVTRSTNIFYIGVTLLGLGTGLSTVANLSLMFDFTMPGMVGLYIGAWGFSNALSRLTGSILGGVVRDVVNQATGQALSGYLVVFAIEAMMLLVAAIMLTRIDIKKFAKGVEEPSFVEKVALAAE